MEKVVAFGRYRHALANLDKAEATARSGGDLTAVLSILRGLSLDEFNLFLMSMPDSDYPALSSILPHMASDEVQSAWTGSAGVTLLKQTTSFVRQVENNFTRYAGRPLRGSTILDFGCGYGRIIRAMYYYSNPAKIWGVDAWERSLDLCREVALPGNFAQSELVPKTLPVGRDRFDLAFAFSVFTHLAPHAAEAALGAVRDHMKPDGLFVLTIRPIEYWPFHDQTRGTSAAAEMMKQHDGTGFAYLPHNGPEGKTYGDSSIAMDYFHNLKGWKFVAHDWSLEDVYQMSIILRPN